LFLTAAKPEFGGTIQLGVIELDSSWRAAKYDSEFRLSLWKSMMKREMVVVTLI